MLTPSKTLRGALAAAAFAAATALAPAPAAAQTFTAGDIVVEVPWTRATPGGARVAGGYMRITNNGSEPDRLLGGSTNVASRFEVHSMETVDGVARMAEVAGGLVIPPGETVELAPGGYHVMMMDLSAPVTEDAEVTGTLVFERAGELTVTYAVSPMGSREAPGGHDHHHGQGQHQGQHHGQHQGQHHGQHQGQHHGHGHNR